MIAFLLLPVYIALNLYIFHRLWNFLTTCGKVFLFKWTRLILFIVYEILSFTPLIGFLLPYGTAIKAFTQRLANYWFAVIIYTLIVVAIGHLFSLLFRKVFKIIPHDFFKKGPSHMICGIISLVLIVTISGYGLYHARDVQLKDYSVTVNKTIGDEKELKVVLLSDLHLGYSVGVNHIEKMVDIVNSQNPDIVCIAGDIYDNDYDAIENPDKIATLLAGMKSTYGTYACWGNHDVDEKILSGFTFNYDDEKSHDKRMSSFFKKANITLLEDESVLIDNKFYVVGRVDESKPATENNERKTPSELLQDLDKTKPVIVIYHEPDELEELSQAGTDLLLCGHTHDGQIFPGNLINKLFWENSYGYLKKGNMHNIVTSGVGVYGPYMRIGTDSEVVAINVNLK